MSGTGTRGGLGHRGRRSLAVIEELDVDDPINADGAELRLFRPRLWHRPTPEAGVPSAAGVPARLWNAGSGQFNGVALRAAIVARGWTVREFAVGAQVSKGCIYKALAGRAVSDRTVLRITSLLETRAPSMFIDG